MKIVIIIGVLAILGYGAYSLSQPSETTPVDTVTESNTDEQADHMEEMNDTENTDMSEDSDMMDTNTASADADVVVDVSGTNFEFDVTEIRVKEGETVTVNFVSSEGFHDWVVDEFDAATEQVRPGTPTSVTFVADKAGTYEYYCSVGSHRAQGMVGTLIVE